MSDEVSRRAALKVLGAIPLAGAIDWSESLARAAAAPPLPTPDLRRRSAGESALAFFTPHEFDTVRILVDYIIPRDERSGSATEAKVPEWMDAFLADDLVTSPPRRIAIRGGLAWMDRECHERWGKTFVGCTDAERRALLDDIAWPAKAPAHLQHGAAFFSTFRDLTASGFWSSAEGTRDLRYIGNTFVPEWTGCSDAALRKLGVAYD